MANLCRALGTIEAIAPEVRIFDQGVVFREVKLKRL
jgi:hypothetical protein